MPPGRLITTLAPRGRSIEKSSSLLFMGSNLIVPDRYGMEWLGDWVRGRLVPEGVLGSTCGGVPGKVSGFEFVGNTFEMRPATVWATCCLMFLSLGFK